MLHNLFIILAVLHTISVSDTSLSKRVLNGIPLKGRSMGYNSIRYYTWLSNGHECDIPLPGFVKSVLPGDWEIPMSFLGMQCAPTANRLLCGGSLITPSIVQTACHCVARFRTLQLAKELRLPILTSIWEDLIRVYVGSNSVDFLRSGMPAKAYFIHQKCAQLYPGEPVWLIHDYGWISLTFSVFEYANLKFAPINFAPMYTIEELAKIWHYTIDRALVCMFIGHGGYIREKEHIKSVVIRHGWALTLDYRSCYYYSKGQLPMLERFNYTRDSTWSCTRPFPKHDQAPGKGDSGGPQTCDNQYFAIISQKTPAIKTEEESYEDLALSATIAFAVFENAIEYRQMFMEAIKDYDGYRAQFGLPTFRPYTHTVV